MAVQPIPEGYPRVTPYLNVAGAADAIDFYCKILGASERMRMCGSDGTIGQYSLGGPGNKRTILAAEGLDPVALEDSARRGERLTGSTTTKITCWPTCRHARRVVPGRAGRHERRR